VAYLDDVSISGSPESVFSAFEQLCTDAERIGLAVQKDKCEVLTPSVGEFKEELQQTIQRHGLTLRGAFPLLGTVVGNNIDEMQKLVNEKVEGWKKALQLLAYEEIPTQLALLVGRWTMTLKPNMLARSLPPSITTRPLADFGEAVVKTMEQRLRLSLQGDARRLFQLPLRGGGLGFCPPEETAPYAFLAGYAATCLALKQTNMSEDEKGFAVQGGWLFTQIQECLSRYITPNLEWPEKEALKDVPTFSEHFSDFKRGKRRSLKLQARLVCTFRSNQRKQLKETLAKETVARMESRSNKASALLWKAYPLTKDFALTDEEMRFSVAYATGQRLASMPDRCGCANKSQLTMEHTVHCAEKLTRHNMIQERFVEFARLHGVTTRQNPRLTYQDAKERLEPDVIFYPGTHAPIQTDVTVINPCAPSRIGEDGSKRGHRWATTQQKAKKNLKYLAKATAKGDLFKPLVLETHGKMGEEIDLLLDLLASQTPTSRGLAVTDMKLRLATTLAKGNALAARTTIARAQRARDTTRAVHPLAAASNTNPARLRVYRSRRKA